MVHTALSTEKGQITIPSEIRKKYSITKDTPLQIIDEDHGCISIHIMNLMPHEDIKFFEDDKKMSLTFKRGLDPQMLIEAIRKIDG